MTRQRNVRPARILWAENGLGDRALIQAAARTLPVPCEVHFYDDALTLLLSLRNNPAELVVLDLDVPGMNGAEALHRIRKSPVTRNQAVAVYSSQSEGDFAPGPRAATETGIEPGVPYTDFVAALGHLLASQPTVLA